MSDKTIVLTGASGVIGKALLPHLVKYRVICLVHRGAASEGAHEVIRCDVSKPKLGLEDAAYRELVAKADCIVHSAAQTDWSAPQEQFQTINVGGTGHVIELARAAGAPIYHISTSFIQALAPGASIKLDPGNVIVNYVASKIACEELFRQSGVAHTLLRPTNLIGDSRTGAIARTQVVQLVSEFVCRGKLPVFPARPGTLTDVLPQDLVAQAIAAVIDADDLGQEYWLTAGAGAMTVAETLEQCVAFAARMGRPIKPPRIVDPDEVDPAQIAALSPMSRQFFHQVRQFTDGLTACGVFPSSLATLCEKYDLPRVSLAECYIRGLEYWAAAKGWGRPAAK